MTGEKTGKIMATITRIKRLAKIASYCKKCSDGYRKACHSCGRTIDIFNHIEREYFKNGKLHIIGRCCGD